MRSRISITQKYFIYFLFLYVVSITKVGGYSYYIAKNSILERTFNQLTSVRVEKSKKIEQFISDRIREIQVISNLKNIEQMFLNFQNIENEKFQIISFLQLFLSSNDYFKNIYFINPNRKIISINL